MGLEGQGDMAQQESPVEKLKPKGNKVTVRITGSNSNLTVAGGSLGGNEINVNASGNQVNAEVNGVKLVPDEDGVIRHEGKDDGSRVVVTGGDFIGQTVNLNQERTTREPHIISTFETSSILDTADIFSDEETPEWIKDSQKLQTLFTVFNRLSRGTWKVDQLPELLKERGFEPGSWTARQLKAIYDKNAEVMEWKPWVDTDQ